jgi:hypothetical protein
VTAPTSPDPGTALAARITAAAHALVDPAARTATRGPRDSQEAAARADLTARTPTTEALR